MIWIGQQPKETNLKSGNVLPVGKPSGVKQLGIVMNGAKSI